MISIKQLHDATLVSLEVDWKSGELRCNLDVGVGATTIVRLLGRGLTCLKCHREFPWGPSEDVNHVQVNNANKNSVVLTIEMQSGDVIEADLQDVVLDCD